MLPISIRKLFTITITLGLILCTSCTIPSGSKFDLSQNALGQNIQLIQQSKNVTFTDPNPDVRIAENYSDLRTFDTNFLNLFGINFQDSLTSDSNYGRNHVEFYFHDSDSKVGLYALYTYTTSSTQDLLNVLVKNLGKEDYTSYSTTEDMSKGLFNAKLWEDKVNHITYALRINTKTMHDKTTRTGLLMVVDTANPHIGFTDYTFAIEFSYWKDYLQARKQKNDSSYTYQQYLVDSKASGYNTLSYTTK